MHWVVQYRSAASTSGSVLLLIVLASAMAVPTAADSASGPFVPPWLEGAANATANGTSSQIQNLTDAGNATSPVLANATGNVTGNATAQAAGNATAVNSTTPVQDQGAAAWNQATRAYNAPVENPFASEGPPEASPPGVAASVRNTDDMKLAALAPPAPISGAPPGPGLKHAHTTLPAPPPGATAISGVQPPHEGSPTDPALLPDLSPKSEPPEAGPEARLPPEAWIALAALSGALAALALIIVRFPRWPAAFAALFSHVPRDKVFSSESRSLIFQTIRENPGVCAEDVRRLARMSRSAVSHHLEILHRHNLVKSESDGRIHHLYAAGEALDEEVRQALAALRHPRSRRIAAFVSQNPGANQKQICQELAIPASRAHDFLRRLIGTGLVLATQEGRQKRYFPGPQAPRVQ